MTGRAFSSDTRMSAVPVLQIFLAAAACLGLWRLCRAQPKIVIAGFLVRALVGQALFWISYLRLPFARSMQLGDGIWFFALDSRFYLRYATKLVERGPAAILLDAGQYPSKFFVQVLSLCVAAFGSVASVAILLNCAAYLLTCALVVRLAGKRNHVVLAAIACSPASILFSLQPLKDTLFMLLIVAMVAAFRRWEELRRDGGTRTQFLGYALAMCAALFALSGIRWYFSVIAWAAAAFFLVLTAVQTHRKGWALVTSAILLVLLAQSIRLGGGSDLPTTYDRLLNPMTALQWRPAASQEHLAYVRNGFDTTPGATSIGEGRALAHPAAVPRTPAATSPPSSTSRTRAVQAVPSSHTPPAPAVAEGGGHPDIAPVVPAPGKSTTVLPTTLAARVITGFAAMFLPRMVGESLGLIRVGGGRGLWVFAETDTLLFDLVLFYTIFYGVRALRRGDAKMTATFIFCLLVFVMTAGPMLYTVNNFGTLFRLRLMVYVAAAILPLTLRYVGPPCQAAGAPAS
jgi:hypothetical protein